MSVRDPYPHDVERLVDLAAREASTTDAVRWDMATPTERVLARWVLEARAHREARQVYDENEPGEVARAQAREPGVRHRRRMLNMLLAAWDANPGAQLGELLARAAWVEDGSADPSRTTDADLLEGLRRLTRETV